jgi:surface antigen
MKPNKTIKVFFGVLLGVCLVIGLVGSSDKLSKNEPHHECVEPNFPGYSTFVNGDYGLSFWHPADWRIEERKMPESGVNAIPVHCIYVQGGRDELVNLLVFNRPDNVETWIHENRSEFFMDKVSNLKDVKSTVSGLDGFSWLNYHRDRLVGATILCANEDYMYELNFRVGAGTDILALNDIIQTLKVGAGGKTELSFDPLNTDFDGLGAMIQVQDCCDVTDSGTNGYPCCGGDTGNCTWYCEYAASGSNNFSFGGQYGHAYMWLEHAWNSGYSVGGTIPEVGAIMVLRCDWYGYGHVAWVSSVNGDGSITVNEQNWCSTCTQSKSYSANTLRGYLGGYIYRDGSRPDATSKDVYGYYTGQITTIDDFNFNSTYNFQTYGPGQSISCSYGNHRGWQRSGGLGYGYNNYYHYTVTQTGSCINYGKWEMIIRNTGVYEIQAFIPGNHATATRARYKVCWYTGSYWTTTYSNGVDQNNTYDTWVKLTNPNRGDGNWYFSANSSTPYVKLEDNYGGNSPESGRYLGFDAIRFIKR